MMMRMRDLVLLGLVVGIAGCVDSGKSNDDDAATQASEGSGAGSSEGGSEGGSESGDGDGDGDHQPTQACSEERNGICCGGQAYQDCGTTLAQRIENLHGLEHWPVICDLPSPCATLVLSYVWQAPNNPTYSVDIFECIASNMRDGVPGRYVIQSITDYETVVHDYVFEVLPGGEVLQGTYTPADTALDCEWEWGAHYLAGAEAFDACIATPVDGKAQISCLVGGYADVQLGCAALDSSSC